VGVAATNVWVGRRAPAELQTFHMSLSTSAVARVENFWLFLVHVIGQAKVVQSRVDRASNVSGNFPAEPRALTLYSFTQSTTLPEANGRPCKWDCLASYRHCGISRKLAVLMVLSLTAQ